MSGQVSLEGRCFNVGVLNGVLTFGINSLMRFGNKNWYVIPLLYGSVNGVSSGLGVYFIENNKILKELDKTTKTTILHAFLFFSICTIIPTIFNWQERVISYSAFAYKQLPFSAFSYLLGLTLNG